MNNPFFLNRFLLFPLMLLISAFCLSAVAVPIVPAPKSIKVQGAAFGLTPDCRILFAERAPQARLIETSLKPLADVLAQEIELLTGLRPVVAAIPDTETRPTDIVLRFLEFTSPFAASEAEEDQSYTLRVSASNGVDVASQYSKGVAYGTASLLQAIRSKEGGGFDVPGLRIDDKPTSAFRTIMIDVARYEHSIQMLKGVVQTARMYKYRYVHLHLTDDQNFTFPFAPVIDKLEGNKHYTRDELKDLVAFANARGVTLIPEMDLPGHSSRLKKSGYLNPGKTDRDVADAANHEQITAIIDDMLTVFENTPYFHIGGDESGAGPALVPFLARINKHVRSRPEFQRPRLLVWEGFHGSPVNELPPKGDDRVVVVAWESGYNPPWNLLQSGYQIVNASWKPTYVVGGGGLVHPGSGFPKFELRDLYRWNKDIFMHWEPGRPVYEDFGPNDANRDDSEWDARVIGLQNQILGGQVVFWELHEDTVLDDLRERAPVCAERLWTPEQDDDYASFAKRLAAVDETVMTTVQPVDIQPWRNTGELMQQPMDWIYQTYAGEKIRVTLHNRSKIPGTIRYTERPFSGTPGYIRFEDPEPVTGVATPYVKPMDRAGGFGMRARLFREDGTAVGSETWVKYNNWPNKVRVTEFDIDRKEGVPVPDFATFTEDRVIKRYEMPFVRGRLPNTEVVGQLQHSLLTAPGSGGYSIRVRTQSGHASLWLDLDQNGSWEPNNKLITDTANDEKNVGASFRMEKGEVYPLRIDHVTGIPRPVLLVEIKGPNSKGPGKSEWTLISSHLSLPDGE